jgi:hypothetical protein
MQNSTKQRFALSTSHIMRGVDGQFKKEGCRPGLEVPVEHANLADHVTASEQYFRSAHRADNRAEIAQGLESAARPGRTEHATSAMMLFISATSKWRTAANDKSAGTGSPDRAYKI